MNKFLQNPMKFCGGFIIRATHNKGIMLKMMVPWCICYSCAQYHRNHVLAIKVGYNVDMATLSVMTLVSTE